MAERVVSPGVFTNEIDQSFLPAAISNLGAALIGTCNTGPAFVPTKVDSYSDFSLKFGGLDTNHFLPYAAKSYLKNAGTATIVRVLGTEGYSATEAVLIKTAGTAGNGSTGSLALSGTGTDGDFIKITGTSGTQYRFIIDTAPLSPNTDTDFYVLGQGVTAQTTLARVFVGAIDSSSLSESEIGNWAVHTDGDYKHVLTISHSAITGDATGSFSVDTGSLDASVGFALSASTNASEYQYGGTPGLQTPNGGVKSVNQSVVAAVFPTSSAGTLATSVIGYSAYEKAGDFSIKWKNTDFSPSMSLNSGDANYIGNVLGEGATPTHNYPGYVHMIFKSYADTLSATDNISISTETSAYGGYASHYSRTPLIQSQPDGAVGNGRGTSVNTAGKINLFAFETLSHGDASNRTCKVAIANIKKAGSVAGSDYGSFDVIVRDFGDTDRRPVALETYAGCNLDPDSPNYVVRRIGDQKESFNSSTLKIDVEGDYAVQSKYIRIASDTVNSNLSNGTLGVDVVPFGFGKYKFPINTEVADVSVDIPMKFNQSGSGTGDYNSKEYHGLAFDSGSTAKTGYAKDLLPYLSALPSTVTSQVTASDFSLGDCGLTVDSALEHKKFILGFQGGTDGFDPRFWGGPSSDGANYGLGHSQPLAADSSSFKNAVATVSNPDEIDINMVVVPGITKTEHTNIYSYTRDKVEDRGDVFYPFDADGYNGTISTAVSAVEAEDTNFASTYYPWVKIVDDESNKQVWVPPSVVVPGVIAFTDKVSHPWFAPAGLNRGGLSEVLMAKDRLTHAERDTLYEGRVNPIATFPGEGVCIWGQKTLQAKPSALDRINVRRLLIALKKFIASSSRYLVFEQNTSATRNRFLNIVNPYMEQVQSNSGLTAFRVVMDSTNNTPDVVDRNILFGQIFLQPTKTAEFIVLDFTIQPTGATFPE